MIRVPRLKLNRHGVFCLRVLWLDESGKRRERLHSLNTKDPNGSPFDGATVQYIV